MSSKKKKIKKSIFKKLILLIALLNISISLYILIPRVFPDAPSIIKPKTYYIASSAPTIDLYKYDKETEKIEKTKEIIRGTKVTSNNNTKKIDEKVYTKIDLDNKKYYILKENLVSNNKDVVLEKEKYIRTSVTVYKNQKDADISSFIKKGNKIEIKGYDFLNEDGSVNMYNIVKDDIKGWVYSKYLTNTEEEAKKVYNENGVYDIHKDRKYPIELYGGSPKTLDYYPYQKPSFKDNELLKDARSMYLNAGTIDNIDSYLKIAKESKVNAIVVDIKDGSLAYPVEIAKTYSKTAYDEAMNSFDKYKDAITKIKKAGIYVIGRIVIFNDSAYGKDHPEDCIKSTSSNKQWPSGFARGAWEYNVKLALQTIDDMGFNEIQFDYVRFPEDAYRMSVNNNSDFKNKYNEEKAEAIQNFLFYAIDQIHKKNVYLSIDVFGEASSDYVTSYGQYWPALSNIVDAISSMPYTDHFGRTTDTWSNPYSTVYYWAKEAATRQKEIPSPAIPRTWITAYDTPYWNPTIIYNSDKIIAQAKALKDAGLNGGFITWNSSSSLAKYNQISSAFSYNYN